MMLKKANLEQENIENYHDIYDNIPVALDAIGAIFIEKIHGIVGNVDVKIYKFKINGIDFSIEDDNIEGIVFIGDEKNIENILSLLKAMGRNTR